MKQQTAIHKPLAEQIVLEMLKELEEHKEFDADTLLQLRKLSETGGLRKHQQVESVLKPV